MKGTIKVVWIPVVGSSRKDHEKDRLKPSEVRSLSDYLTELEQKGIQIRSVQHILDSREPYYDGEYIVTMFVPDGVSVDIKGHPV